MAQGYGWGDAIIDGFKDGRRQEDVRQQREERALGIKSIKNKMADEQRARDLQTSRQQDLIAAQQPQQSADGSPMSEVRPFEAYSAAAKKRLAAGDMDGYESFASKADAHMAKFYADEFGSAYRTGDANKALSLMNSMPDGIKYERVEKDGGGLSIRMYGPDAKVIGEKPFKSNEELLNFVAGRVDPANIFQKLRDQRKRELDELKLNADIKQSEAAAAASNSTATYNTERTAGQKIENQLTQQYGPLEFQAKIGLTKAQTGAANANAGESAAGAGLKRRQAATLPTADEAKNDRIALQISQTAARMAADHNKLHPYAPENHKTAEDFMGQATANFERGRQAVKPGTGFARPAAGAQPISGPGIPPAKDFSNLWK